MRELYVTTLTATTMKGRSVWSAILVGYYTLQYCLVPLNLLGSLLSIRGSVPEKKDLIEISKGFVKKNLPRVTLMNSDDGEYYVDLVFF